MARAKKQNVNNTINIKSLPVQCHIGASKFVNDDWGTIAFCIPRNQIQNKFTDPELRYNFIYFLFGYENSKEVVYVGQAKKRNNGESVLKRLREHDTSTTEKYRDKWIWIVAVTNKNDAWGLDDLNALEHAFYNEIPADQNLNGNNPNSGGADYEAYADKISQIKGLITAIGYTIFNKEEITEKMQVTPEINGCNIVEDLHSGMARIPEIVTPQKVVKEMIDMLPQEVWNSKTKFLDPACKGGEYLREVYDRLMETEILQSEFPNAIERSNHILKNQIYGIALSQVSLERTTKKLLGEDRNIRVIADYINKLKGNNMGSRPDGSQQNIMDILNKEFGKNMKFDVVIGNPPYQELDGSGLVGGTSIYHKFIDLADEIADKQSFIIPSRWMSDNPRGIGDAWKKKMRTRTDYIYIKEFADSTKCFNGVSIAGGVCYFLIDKRHNGTAKIMYEYESGAYVEKISTLSKDGIIIRNGEVDNIVSKILKVHPSYIQKMEFANIFGSSRTFSKSKGSGLSNYLESNWTEFSDVESDENYIKFFTNRKLLADGKLHGYVSESDLAPGTLADAKKFNLFLLASAGEYVKPPIIGGYNSCCSTTYTPLHSDKISDYDTANNLVKYFKTKFFRILSNELRTTQHVSRSTFQLVPMQDFTNQSDIDWSQSIADIDKQLYKKYNLTEEEIAYIEQTIKPMA